MDHHINHEHTQHEDQQMGASHHEHEGMIGDFKKRFLVSLILTVPILLLSKMIQEWSGINISFPYDDVVLLSLSTIVYFYGGWPFLKGSLDEMKQKNPGMMMLIALAISVAYFYSVGIILGLGEGHDFFWELATLIDIMLLGHWIEMKSIMGASNALQELVKLLPSIAHRIDDEKIEDIAVSELQTGDVILIKPGEQIPVDGKIIKGATTVDESMLTGESLPIEKKMDDNVIAGSINQEGSLTVETKNTGEGTYLSKVIELVSEAQASKSKTQNLANRAAKILFYVAVIAGVLTFIIWLALGYPLSIAVERMVTVMVISCPHALGLAAPLVVSVSTALSAKKGLLIRNRTQFEEARKLDAIIFDKTGTLTQGNFGVTDLVPIDEISSNELLRLAAGVERSSQHPLAKGVVKRAEELQLSLPSIEDFMSITGVGLEGKVEGTLIRVVSPRYIRQEKITIDELAFEKLSEEGKTVIFVLKNKQLLGMIALADLVREEAKETVTALKNKGINSIMLTGDNKKVAHWVAKQLGIDEVHAEVLPDDKSR
ncbi:heavy metal translocating P-type ATPase, partial [Exiguobacterium sp. 22311]|uniref:heavy metal translocating P-type ATPase n=1 Tax=Exiguobacterium sp. 22311 TaxID=3453907 RepID=UPI003F862813